MKTVFIIASILIVLGIILFVAVMAGNSWDIAQLGTAKLQNSTYTIEETFQNISVHTDTADVVFVLSDDKLCKVACYERENTQHLVTAKNGTLDISNSDTRKWYEYISFFFFVTISTRRATSSPYLSRTSSRV